MCLSDTKDFFLHVVHHCVNLKQCVLFLTAHVCVCKYHADVSTICMRHLNQDFIEDSFPKNDAYRTCILGKLTITSIIRYYTHNLSNKKLVSKNKIG